MGHALSRTLGALLLVCATANGTAQECSDGNDCTVDDVCAAGVCRGTPAVGASCQLQSDALVNGRCTVSGTDIRCQGEPAPLGAACSRGCGTVQELFPGLPVKICAGPAEMLGQPCPDLGPLAGPCTSGTCVRNGPEIACAIRITQCPDADGDPCTRESCSNDTGRCETHPACQPECETCTPGTGECVAANLGAPCDDGNPCTAESQCRAVDFPGYRIVGLCEAASVPTRTPTVPATATPTATPTIYRCVGDCDRDGAVRVNELVIGVNIALARASFFACAPFDESANRQVEVHELVRGVNNLLTGCGQAAGRAARGLPRGLGACGRLVDCPVP